MLRISRIAKNSTYSSRYYTTTGGILGVGSVILLTSAYNDNESTNTNTNKVTYAEEKAPLINFENAKRTESIPSRQTQIDNLSSGKVFDVLVIGGGATGAGTALDAQTRGLSTALIERGDFGNETSSRSTKLIWAGIRYIATACSALLRFRNVLRPMDAIDDFLSEFRMVSNCHKERRLLLDNNPHLTNWIPIAVPMDSWISWPPPFGHPVFACAPIVMPLVFKFYDGMSGFTCPASHIMGKSRAERKFPQLAAENAKYYSVFYEGQHNDARTATYIALTVSYILDDVSNSHTERKEDFTNDERFTCAFFFVASTCFYLTYTFT